MEGNKKEPGSSGQRVGCLSAKRKLAVGALALAATLGVLALAAWRNDADQVGRSANLSPHAELPPDADDKGTSGRGFDLNSAAGQLAFKKDIEGYLALKAQTMLAEVLGEGQAIVRVDATLNFEQLQESREIYDPAGAVVRSEEHDESTTNQSAGASERSATSYEINKTLQTLVGEVGNVRRLSVSVFVDGHHLQPGAGDATGYVPLTDDELRQLERVVQTALGVNPERGDRVEVVNMRFRGRGARPAPASQRPGGAWLPAAARNVGNALLLATGVALLLVLFGAFQKPLGLGAAGARRAAGRGDGTEAANGAAAAVAAAEADRMVDEVRDYAAGNPEAMAELVKAWLGERA